MVVLSSSEVTQILHFFRTCKGRKEFRKLDVGASLTATMVADQPGVSITSAAINAVISQFPWASSGELYIVYRNTTMNDKNSLDNGNRRKGSTLPSLPYLQPGIKKKKSRSVKPEDADTAYCPETGLRFVDLYKARREQKLRAAAESAKRQCSERHAAATAATKSLASVEARRESLNEWAKSPQLTRRVISIEDGRNVARIHSPAEVRRQLERHRLSALADGFRNGNDAFTDTSDNRSRLYA